MKIYERNNIQRQLETIYSNNIYNASPNYVEYNTNEITNPYFLKPIAFYLPQFYATAINDKNWGAGFTEWTNVAKAVPQYYGHYQPHIPERLGYYNLENINVMEEQCRLARNYGIYGFCFYYYFFQGENQLEFPVRNFAENPNISFPFCLCWANENWTRRWDGKNEEILLRQRYSYEDMRMLISKVSKYFIHKKYIKIDHRPLFIIYNPLEIPNLDEYIKLWRNLYSELGLGELFLVCAKTFGLDNIDIIKKFDACVEFPPHGIHIGKKIDYSLLTNKFFEGSIYQIKEYIDNLDENYTYNLFKCAFPSWDNTARVGKKAKIFSDASPETFKLWLNKIINYTIKSKEKDKRYFFINAWNEWGEGAHLEPDRKFGYAYLDVLRKCIEEKR